MDTVIIVLLVLVGFGILMGSVFNWDLMFRSSLAKQMVKKIGIDATKIIYGAIGMAMIVAAIIMVWVSQSEQPLQAKPDATALLSVGPDGCTVSRTEVVGSAEIDHLQWKVMDQNFQTVFTRIADNELSYRYIRAGIYDVNLQAWYKGGYVTISNKVKINCTALTP